MKLKAQKSEIIRTVSVNLKFNTGSYKTGCVTEPALNLPLTVDDFAVIGVSLYYKSVEEEINQLAHVHEEMKNRWGDISTLIMGDFMADGRYCSHLVLYYHLVYTLSL